MNVGNQADLKAGFILFAKDFQLESTELDLSEDSTPDYHQIFEKILLVVKDLLANDFNRLINILYRIDVPEQKLKKALSITTEDPASVITKMILKRELEKVETRKKYN